MTPSGEELKEAAWWKNNLIKVCFVIFIFILFFSNRVRVPQRQGSTKVQLKGIFVGAKVVRGPDWEWGVQDGGEGK